MRITDLSHVTNEELLVSLQKVHRTETNSIAQMLVHLVEIQERRLHLEMACSSMFDFCTKKLGLSEGTAQRRIVAARLIRRFPTLLDAIASGRIHLSGLHQLRDLFTKSNVDELLDAAAGKSKRALEELVARLAPKPHVAPSITVVPEQGTFASGASRAEPAPPPPMAVPGSKMRDAQVSPLSDVRYLVQLTTDGATRERLDYATALMRHANPSGDLGVVFAAALEALIEKLEKRKLGKTSRPRTSRTPKDPSTVTQATRREVVERDGYQCTFVSAAGERCASKDFLELDHALPRACDGPGNASNVRVLCRAHNRLAAEKVFGRKHVERQIHRRRRKDAADPAARAILHRALVGMGFRTADADRALGRFGPEAWSRPVEALLRDALAVLT